MFVKLYTQVLSQRYVGEYTGPALDLPFLSTLSKDARFPRDRTGRPHADGQALSGALWEARAIAGASVLDRALYNTIAALPEIIRRERERNSRFYTFPLVAERILARLDGKAEPAVPPRCTGITIALFSESEKNDEGDKIDEGDIILDSGTLQVYVRAKKPIHYRVNKDSIQVEADWVEIASEGKVDFDKKRVKALRNRTMFPSLRSASKEDKDMAVTITIESK